MGGCGLIIYYLNKPFEEYQYDTVTRQWKELYRNNDDVWWIFEINAGSSPSKVKFSVESNYTENGVYEIDVYTLSIKRIESE